MLVCSVALAGCVGVPVEELLASTAIVAELQRENGALVEAARFSAGRAGEAPPGGWDPFIVSPFSTRTEYRLVESDLSVVLEANAAGSASGFYRRIRIDPTRYPVVEWRWRVLQPLASADPRVPSRADSAARLVISFHGDVTARLRRAHHAEALQSALRRGAAVRNAHVYLVKRRPGRHRRPE